MFHFAMYLAYDLGFHIILCSSVFSGLAVDTCLPRQLATERAGHGTVGDGRQAPETLGIRGMSEDDGRRRRPATEEKTGDGGSGWRFVPFTVLPTFTFYVIIYLGTLGTLVMQ